MTLDLATRVFDMAGQERFALLSGDRNPIHVDPVAARRTQAGAPVVHGIHAVLWALDEVFAVKPRAKPVTALGVRFQKFIYLGTPVHLREARASATALRIELVADNLVTTTIDLEFAKPAHEPIVVLGSQLEAGSPEAAAAAFPRAARALGAERIAAIASLSRLVGMICPGLHSLFSGCALDFTAEPNGDGTLRFEVRDVDERFGHVEIAVSGGGIAGTVTAFERHAPVPQRSLQELRSLVDSREFCTTTALVVGGSRGLGALTAKIIAAGGGRVVITYATGEADARAVAQEIGAAASRVMHYDARESAAAQLAQLEWEVDQLYYFATPHISRQKPDSYSQTRFEEFCDMYVRGFEDVCSALRARQSRQLSVFYPSSVFVEQHPKGLTEYANAKAAGEALCAELNAAARGPRIIAKRLPRVLTDQTATMMPVETADPLLAMLPIVREMSQGAG